MASGEHLRGSVTASVDLVPLWQGQPTTARASPQPQVSVLHWEFWGERAGDGACGPRGQGSSVPATTHPRPCSRATGDGMYEESADGALHCPTSAFLPSAPI